MDAAAHKKVTGKSNEVILNNLKLVTAAGVPVIIRIPVIPGINDVEDNLKAVARYVKELKNIEEVNLLPYHRYGENKYEMLDRKYHLSSLTPPEDAHMEKLVSLFEDMNINVKIVK